MKAVINIKTTTLAAALTLSLAMSAASHAAADARTVNAFNEGSEPGFLLTQTSVAASDTPALVKSEDRAKVSAAPKTMSSGFFAKFDQEVLYRKLSDADARALNAVNEGQVNLAY